jgi:diamine N-acetyltransferase
MGAGPRHVSLREITDANRRAVESLAVTPDQETYVAGVAESLVEAAVTPAACPWYRAVYAGDEPVGFVMLSDGIPDGHPEYLGPYFLWRLLIDARRRARPRDRLPANTAGLRHAADVRRARAGFAHRVLPALRVRRYR